MLGRPGILTTVAAHQLEIEFQRPGCPPHQFVTADPLTPRDVHNALSPLLGQANQGPRRGRVVERGPEFIFEERLRLSRPEACKARSKNEARPAREGP